MANSMLVQVIESMEHLQHDQQCLSILGRWIERHREGVSSSSSSSSSGGSFRSWLSISTTISKPIEEARPTQLHREVCRVVVEEIWLISLAWLGEQRRSAHTSKVIEHVDDGPVRELQRHLILSIELVLLLERWETSWVLFEHSQVEHRLDGHLSRGREHDASRSRVGIVRSDGTRDAAISPSEISLRAMTDSKVGELGHSEGLGSECDVAIQPSLDQ